MPCWGERSLDVLLAGWFCLSIVVTGRWLTCRWKLPAAVRWPAAVVAGMAGYAAVVLLLGQVGWLHWQILAGLSLLPGAWSLPSMLRSWRRLLTAVAGVDTSLLLPWLFCLLLHGVLLLHAEIHYDNLIGYLEVPKQYLLQHAMAPLSHNMSSRLSPVLHAWYACALALQEPYRTLPFRFGDGGVVHALHLWAFVFLPFLLSCLVRLVPCQVSSAAAVGRYAALLFMTLPGTLVWSYLSYADIMAITPALAGLALLPAAREHAVAGWLSGMGAGLMLMAKYQTAPLVLLLGIASWLIAGRAAAVRWLAGCMLAVLPVLPHAVRCLAGGEVIRGVLAENEVLAGAASDYAAGLWRMLTRPEAGALLLLPLLWPRSCWRSPLCWLAIVMLLLAPLLTPQAHHALRWNMLPILLVILLAGIDMDHRRWHRMVFAVWLTLTLVPAVTLVDALRMERLLLPRTELLEISLPGFAMRRELVKRPGRAFCPDGYYGYYGTEAMVVPSVLDRQYITGMLAGTPADVLFRLRRAGFARLLSQQEGIVLEIAPAPGGDTATVHALAVMLPALRNCRMRIDDQR